MEFIFEILADLIIEGCFEASSNKKVPKIIRYPLIALIVLFFASVIFGIFILGISLWNKNIYGSLFIILLSIIMLIVAVYRLKKIYIEKENKDEVNEPKNLQ